MHRTLSFIAAAVLAAGIATATDAQKLDSKGKRHDAKGKMAKKEMCKAA
jgi:hypothetical protein